MPAQKVSRPNFFILLGLHPDTPWDQAHFEQALLQKRGEWSRQSAGVAKKALAAKQNLALLPQIYAVMNDPAQREKEADAARKALNSEKTALLEQFEKQLALINAKDTVEPEELEHFVNAFKDLLSPKEIMDRITVPIRTPEAPPVPEEETSPTLEESLVGSIKDRLHILDVQTLYEFLQLPRTTATHNLQHSAEMLYIQVVRLSPSAEATAKAELAGLAKQVFSSEEMRAQYDESLRQTSLLHLFKELDESMKHAKEKELHQKQVLIFLSQARKDGWPEQETLERLKEHARQKKWIVTLPDLDHDAGKILCPNCETLNNKDQRFCTACQQALYIACPRCGQQTLCEYKACGNCGFPVGNRYLIVRLVKELQQELKAGNLARAQQLADEAGASWQLGPDQQDLLTQQIAACRAQIRRMRASRKQAHKDALEVLRHLTIREVETDHMTPGTQNIQSTHASEKRQVHVEWDTPSEGTVIIIKSSQPLPQEGQTLAEDQLDKDILKVGQCLPKVHLANIAVDQWKPAEVVYYTPAVLFQQQIHVGFSQLHVCVEGISQLRFQNLGSSIRLYWIWPAQSQEVRISYRTTQWPRHDAPDVTTILLSRSEYDRTGYYEIREPAHRDYYIAISSILPMHFPSGEEQFFSQDTRLHVQTISKMVMTYQIKSPTRLRKKRQLYLTLDSPMMLPSLILICKQGRLPFRKTDGDLFYRIEATTTHKNQVIFELPDTPLPPKTFGKLFLEDDARYHEFTVHHPDMDQMRLS